MANIDFPAASFKKLPYGFTAYVCRDSYAWGNLHMVKNALVIWVEGNLVYCEDFPANYAGKSPMLKVWYWNFKWNVWECVTERSRYTQGLYAIWCNGGCKKTGIEYDYASLMKHDRRHKRASGQREYVNAITDYDCVGCPQMRAKHVEGYTAYMPYGDGEYRTKHA